MCIRSVSCMMVIGLATPTIASEKYASVQILYTGLQGKGCEMLAWKMPVQGKSVQVKHLKWL